MNKTDCSRMVAGFCCMAAALWSCAQAAEARAIFGTPALLGPPVNVGSTEYGASISADGLELYYDAWTGGQTDVWVATRATRDDGWVAGAPLGPAVNGSSFEWSPRISADGLELYFERYRSSTSTDIYVARRSRPQDTWQLAERLNVSFNGSGINTIGSLSVDGLELYYTNSGRLCVATRTTRDSAWKESKVLTPNVSGEYPAISPDGLLLLFSSSSLPGGLGGLDIWMMARVTRDGDWSAPVNLGPPLNSEGTERRPWISYDGSRVLFTSGAPFEGPRPGGVGSADVWQALVLPACDLNNDGNVDEKDILVMQAHWGQADPSCDIGPLPWGDGIVDTHDLAVLMKAITGLDARPKPLAHAVEVPRDVILSWMSAPFAQSYDVYLGTSVADVNSADRAHPNGVLVSQDQPATAYDPPGLLDFGRTYWWRVDFVSAGPVPVVYKGAVVDFTTEPFARPITSIIATASSLQGSSGAEKTVDGSGLDKSDGHSTDAKDMWWSSGKFPNWIQYEFNKVYMLHELWVWNFNLSIEPYMGFGAKTVKIEYSTDGTAWTPLANVPEFAQAPGKAGYTADTKISFGGVPAKFVKLTIEKNWGGKAPQTGLSEVRFLASQDAAAATQP